LALAIQSVYQLNLKNKLRLNTSETDRTKSQPYHTHTQNGPRMCSYINTHVIMIDKPCLAAAAWAGRFDWSAGIDPNIRSLVCRRWCCWPHATLYFGRHRQECLFDVRGILCTCLQEWNVEPICKLLSNSPPST